MKTSNYPNWLVSIEIAKSLKEIGYKEKCCFEFSLDNGLTLEINKREEEDTIIEIDDLLFCTNEIWQNVSVPTWEQVLEWFRNKKFYSIIDYCGDKHYSFRILKMGTLSFETNNKVYSTYEQAREILVEKLIETYKQDRNENNI